MPGQSYATPLALPRVSRGGNVDDDREGSIVKLGVCVASHVGDVGYVVRAEELGFASAWLADSQMLWSDCYAALALVADRTRHIRIGTGVAVTGLVATAVGSGSTSPNSQKFKTSAISTITTPTIPMMIVRFTFPRSAIRGLCLHDPRVFSGQMEPLCYPPAAIPSGITQARCRRIGQAG